MIDPQQKSPEPVAPGIEAQFQECSHDNFNATSEAPQFDPVPFELYADAAWIDDEPDHADAQTWADLAEPVASADEVERARQAEFYEFTKPFEYKPGTCKPIGLLKLSTPKPDPKPVEELVALEDMPRAALVEVPLGDVMSAEIEPVSYAAGLWLPRRHVALFSGHGGIGKSSLALAIGAHVAAGKPFAGREVEQLPVLFVSLEDEPRIVRLRLRRIIEAYRLDPDEVLPRMRLLDGTQGLSALMSEGDGPRAAPAFTPAFRELVEQAAGCGVVIVDNASDAFDANENVRSTVRAFIRGLAVIARKHDAAVVLLAHIDKAAARYGGGDNNFSGSTAWHNSCRSRLALLERDGQILLAHEKNNLGPRDEPLPVMFVDGVPMPATGASGYGLQSEDFDKSEIIRVMRCAAEAGIDVPASLTPGAHSAMKALEPLPEYGQTFKGRAGNSRAAAAIAALRRDGRIREETYRTRQRKDRTRLVIVEGSAQNGDHCADGEG